jgi:hypothetical protein
MNPTTQPNEPQELYEPELAIKAPTDDSLSAAQVLTEQIHDAEEQFTPRYIP